MNHFRRITSSGKFIKYFTLQADLYALQKQLIFRSKNLGMKQLDLLIGNWAKLNIPKLDHIQLQAFNEEVLQMQTPVLNKILISGSEQPTHKYLKIIKQFSRNNNYSKIED